jgi:GntR family transcriptional regulator
MLESRTIDKSVPIPLYYQLKTLLLEEIANGSYPEGSVIPTENEISDLFNISRTTVRQAIIELVQEGKLYRIKSKGTFVTKPKITQRILNSFLNYSEHIRNTNRVPFMQVLDLKIVPMPDFMIEIGAGDSTSKAILLYRKRLADNIPVMRNVSYMRYDKCSFLLDYDFSKILIHDALDQRDETRVYRITRTFEAIPAGQEDVTILDMELGGPIQKITSARYNSFNELIEYSYSYYRGDQTRFTIDIIDGKLNVPEN